MRFAVDNRGRQQTCGVGVRLLVVVAFLMSTGCLSAGVTMEAPRVFDVFPGWEQGIPSSSQGRSLPVLRDSVMFLADDGQRGEEPWVSNGTTAGTQLLRDVFPGRTGSSAVIVGVTPRFVYFQAKDGLHGAELWRTDGTQSGTMLVADLEPGATGLGAMNSWSGVSLPNGRLLVPLSTSQFGSEVWVMDALTGAPSLLKDIALGNSSGFRKHLTAVGDRVYFEASDGAGTGSLWTSDGTSTGTRKLLSKDGAPLLDIYYIHEFNGHAIIGVLNTSPQATWISDGTSEGTQLLVTSIFAGTPAECGGLLYWRDGQRRLWRTDGTTQGSTALRAFGYVGELSCLEGLLVFAASDDVAGVELWRSDGTPHGTQMVADLSPGAAGSSPAAFRRLGMNLLFVAEKAGYGRELWITNGTAEQTRMVGDIAPFAASSNVDWVVVTEELAFFAAESSGIRSLWVSDGTATGTRSLNELFPSAGIRDPAQLTVAGEGLFFTASNKETRRELWFLPIRATAQGPSQVVEYYHAALDHYFITATADEISKLDSGYFEGWMRTGYSFWAIAGMAPTPAGASPVCRFYGNPIYGLDSHFYSASPTECAEVKSKFPEQWLFESAQVFQVFLPNTTTGACPAGTVPVYRSWNNRRDSNHRYTTSASVQAQMVAKGYLAEGYGNPPVVMCGYPGSGAGP